MHKRRYCGFGCAIIPAKGAVPACQMAKRHAGEMLFEHAGYPAVSPWLGAPEVHNVACVLGMEHLGLGCRQGVDIHFDFCSAALQDDFL